MKRTVLLTHGLAALFALASFLACAPAAAVDHPWGVVATTNVAAGQHGLWPDIASGSNLGEAGLLWFVNNQNINESVSYKTTDVNINSNVFPILTARAALSDGAEFWVGYATSSTSSCYYPPALKWPFSQADGGYRIKTFTLPANLRIRAVCIYLTDYMDVIASGRSSVLIDYIQLKNAANQIGWREGFQESP